MVPGKYRKCAKYDKHHYSKSEYQKSHQKSGQKYYLSKEDVKFPPAPPSAELCQNIESDFCADTSPDVFEDAGCAVCGKLTPICEMEELSEAIIGRNHMQDNKFMIKPDCQWSRMISGDGEIVKKRPGVTWSPL
jgi:hypothetical protein